MGTPQDPCARAKQNARRRKKQARLARKKLEATAAASTTAAKSLDRVATRSPRERRPARGHPPGWPFAFRGPRARSSLHGPALGAKSSASAAQLRP